MHACMYVFLSFARFVSFCCPKVLILAVEVALSGAVLWILWKAIMGEGRMSIKSILRLFCAAVSTSPSPLRFLPNSQRANKLLLSLPASEARILELWSRLSTGGLADDGAGVCMYTGALHVSVNERWPLGDHRETPVVVGKTCPWAPGPQWRLRYLRLWLNIRDELGLLVWPSMRSSVSDFSSSRKHQRIHFNYKICVL